MYYVHVLCTYVREGAPGARARYNLVIIIMYMYAEKLGGAVDEQVVWFDSKEARKTALTSNIDI